MTGSLMWLKWYTLHAFRALLSSSQGSQRQMLNLGLHHSIPPPQHTLEAGKGAGQSFQPSQNQICILLFN